MPTVLIVEDDADVRESIADVVGREGYTVRTAVHGKDGLRCLRDGGADLVVLDMMMPVMNGSEFLAAKGADPVLASIPVVVTSAACERLPEGARILINKPFELQHLLAVMARLLAA